MPRIAAYGQSKPLCLTMPPAVVEIVDRTSLTYGVSKTAVISAIFTLGAAMPPDQPQPRYAKRPALPNGERYTAHTTRANEVCSAAITVSVPRHFHNPAQMFSWSALTYAAVLPEYFGDIIAARQLREAVAEQARYYKTLPPVPYTPVKYYTRKNKNRATGDCPQCRGPTCTECQGTGTLNLTLRQWAVLRDIRPPKTAGAR
jgi:hypothetical protein